VAAAVSGASDPSLLSLQLCRALRCSARRKWETGVRMPVFSSDRADRQGERVNPVLFEEHSHFVRQNGAELAVLFSLAFYKIPRKMTKRWAGSAQAALFLVLAFGGEPKPRNRNARSLPRSSTWDIRCTARGPPSARAARSAS
jgi:hypothetical protein